MRSEGRSVVVTGAASGIGAAVARRFVEEGAHVSILDVQVDKGRAVAAQLGEEGAHFFECDMTDSAAITRTISLAAERFDGIDVLVNNVGAGALGSVADLDGAEWDRIVALNLSSVFHTSKAAAGHLMRRRGSIVNVASVSGVRGDYGLSAYNATKGAIVNLTRGMALDFAASGVRVNAVSPGWTLTEAFAYTMDLVRAGFEAAIPLGRGAEASEIASVVAFLSSPDASYITGENLVVDGGLTIASGQPNQLEVRDALTAKLAATEVGDA